MPSNRPPPSDRARARRAWCGLGWAVAALGLGCMSDADYTQAITGVSPPSPTLSVDLAPPDRGPPVDMASVDAARVDAAPPPDRCDGIDQDGDGQLDEDALAREGLTCCAPDAGPPCNGAPAGTLLDEGWARVPGHDRLVMTRPLTGARLAQLRGVDLRSPDGSETGAEDPVLGVNLYTAVALANAWSCAHGRASCYRVGDTPVELHTLDALDRDGGPLTRQPDCAAELLSAELFTALTGGDPGEVCDAVCGTLGTTDDRIRRTLGVSDLLLGYEWVWSGAVEGPAASVTGGGCGGPMCRPVRVTAADDPIEVYADWGLRLTCPLADPGVLNPCTSNLDGDGICTNE